MGVEVAETQRQRAKAARHKELLAAAAEIMAKKGFHQTRLANVGAAAGISGPAIYHYVDSKEALLAELLNEISERLVAGAREIVEKGRAENATPKVTLSRLVDFHVNIAVTEPNVVRVQERELRNLTEDAQKPVRILQREYLRVWTDALVQANPELGENEARMRVQLVAGMINSVRYVITWAGQETVREHAYTMAMNSLFS